MHRVAPIATAFRAYSAGGARSVVDAADDSKLMQEMKGGFMAGERRQKVEAPQNYGFSSVVLPSDGGSTGGSAGSGGNKKGAEAFISFIGGSRSFPVAAIMDDRRHRPMGLKPGENTQYDDIGQMTLLRRKGLYMLSLDSEDESQKSGAGGAGAGGSARAGESGSGGQSQKVERMVSMRHIEKKKQEREKQQQQKVHSAITAVATYPLHENMTSAERDAVFARRAVLREQLLQVEERQEQQDAKQKEEFKHEGETVNTEVRATAKRIEVRTGDDVVGHYDKGTKTWQLAAGGDETKSVKVVGGDDAHAHIKIGNNSIWVDKDGCWSSSPIQIKVDPKSVVKEPTLLERIESLEAKVKELETRG